MRIEQIGSYGSGLVITFHQTKTIQFREKQLQFVIPQIIDNPLCLASALLRLLSLHEILGSNGQSPLLCESVIKPLSYVNFVAFINDILASSGCSEKLTEHSFRRGGATFAFHAGLPSENIQDMWKSDAYLKYIEKGLPSKSKALQKFGGFTPIYHVNVTILICWNLNMFNWNFFLCFFFAHLPIGFLG